MLLRSSSTPVLGSLISSISDSPKNHHHHHHYQPEVQPHTANKPPPPTIPHSSHKKLSFHQSPSQNFTTFSCNSSPISSLAEFSSGGTQNSFRRAQSEGNLESLANSSSNVDEFSLSKPPMKFARKPNSSLLQTIPSSSVYNTTSSFEDEDSDNENDDEEEQFEFAKNGSSLDNSFSREERFEGEKKMVMGLNEGMRYGSLEEAIGDGQQMYLARGLGVTGIFDIGFGGGGGGGGTNVGYGGDGGGSGSSDGGNNLEEYYKRMVEENPGNPLFLRNYAQFLYQTKGDLKRAEEYYSRAILADSEDGEILSQYASLIWELHRDEDRAMSYFERAVRTASEDSHVHAAYANFLWQIEDEDEEDEDGVLNHPHVPPLLHPGAMASATA